MPRPARKTQDQSSDAGEVPWWRRRGEKWRGGATPEKKMLKNIERSRNVHENKQKADNLTEKKGDISTQLNDILHKSTRILLKLLSFLSLWECWGTKSALQNIETRGKGLALAFLVRWGFARRGRRVVPLRRKALRHWGPENDDVVAPGPLSGPAALPAVRVSGGFTPPNLQ